MRGNVIFDLQYGSTGKGLIAGYIAERDHPDVVVTAWAANAGHTYIDGEGRKFVHTMLANGIVSPKLKYVLIGPGSVIDPAALRREINECQDLLQNARILIHPAAAVIQQHHRDEEAGPMTKIGSTKKGCGAAAIQRIRRNPDDQNVAGPGVPMLEYSGYMQIGHYELVAYELAQYVCTREEYLTVLMNADNILVEGAQGYGLSMYHGFYPYTTSRDVSVHQVLADCGIPVAVGRKLNVIGTARTYPIRVANRFDERGVQVGWSGPCETDQEEITFESIGQEVELTTVTKLPRRIFTFSHRQMHRAVATNGVDEVFINFMNYLPTEEDRDAFVADVDDTIRQLGARVRYLGYGPTARDVHEGSFGA